MIYEQRTLGNARVDTIRITLDTPPELIAQYAQDGYTEVMEHYLVLYKRPDAEVLQDKLETIAAALPDEIAAEHPDIYPALKRDGTLIKVGTRINWDGVLKRAAVDLWDREDQNPDNAPTLWEDINYHKGYRVIPEVITAGLAFAKNEIGYWPPDGNLYRAINNATVWTPTAYPAGWEKVTIGE